MAARGAAVSPPDRRVVPPGAWRVQAAHAPAHTDNLAALAMGGRVESPRSSGTPDGFLAERALDGDPATVWADIGARLHEPVGFVLSFIGRDIALVSEVTITFPSVSARLPYGWPTDSSPAWPKDVEVWLSTKSATTGFVKAVSATLPHEAGEHVVKLPAPAEARFVKFVFPHNSGSTGGLAVGDVAVHEGQRAGYTPLLARHKDLQALLSTGKLVPDPASLAFQAPGTAPGAACVEPPAPAPAQCPESQTVLLIAERADLYGPYAAHRAHQTPSTIRYFGPGPGDGRVDTSIFDRVEYWALTPDLVRPADFVPSAHVDTVVLEQLCDIKTSVSADVKQALVAWVANGNKLIISDADSCGPGRVPDYAFLPYPFATSNPGGRASASALQIVEKNFLVSPDNHDPAFFDEPSWRTKTNGNISNDFGDSNTVITYDAHWCGALVGTNVIGGSGFVLAYTHYGRGVILYDGIDRDQHANLAYQQYVARQLLLPFRPDPLPCSLRLAPFAVTTDVSLVRREVGGGATVTYPLTVIATKPDFSGSVALSVVPPAAAGGFSGRINPASVTLGAKASATLSMTAPAALTQPLWFAVRGTAGDAVGTLCLAIDALRSGHLSVTADLGPPPAHPESRKNLLIILDLSGSMSEALGKSTRIATARQVLRGVLAKVPDDFNVGLRVYGDRYSSKDKQTCTDSHLVQPVQKLDRAALLKTIDAARPRGETPLVYSVLQALGDLKTAGGGSAVLITDGEESCGGDVTAAAAAIKQSGLDFRLNIVGFTLKGQQAQQALGHLAASTGGAYYGAQDGPALTRALVTATVSTFPFTVRDAAGKVVAQGEAGDAGHDLPAGEYTVVVQAGDRELTLPHVTVAAGQTATVRVTRQGEGFAISGGSSPGPGH
jgi:von Willebrand factor type A domain